MSRIGKRPIEIPDGVKIRQDGSLMITEGPKGVLSREIPEGIAVALEGNIALVNTVSDNRKGRSLHGLARTLIAKHGNGCEHGVQ